MTTTFTNIFFTFFMLFSFEGLLAQGGIWTWVKGSSGPGAPVVYGTQGIANLNNTPTALYEAAHWIDHSGNFWVFGGAISGGDQSSDLWKYDPFSNMWTWMKGPGQWNQAGIYGTKGVSSPNNNPGARGWGIFTWTDLNNNLWMYGGAGYDDNGNQGVLGDLWKYNISTNEWTWVHGSNTINSSPVYGVIGIASPTNTPGARQEANSSWFDDDNNLWLFGGSKLHDTQESSYNDLWKYNIATNRWTYMKGSQLVGDDGNYGTINLEATSNLPPARRAYSAWKDSKGHFYFFGGGDYREPLNYADVWRYNPTTNNWTWISGPSIANTNGIFSNYCEQGHPAGKFENSSPKTNNCGNKVAMFGGGKRYTFTDGSFDTGNDLWTFDITTLEWKWISGSSQLNDVGNPGQIGVPSPANVPHSRIGACMWMDNNGVLWVFGGQDDSPLLHGARNDMWKFVPDPNCTGKLIGGFTINPSDSIVCKNDTVWIEVPNVVIKQILPASTSFIIDSTNALLFPDTTTQYTIVADNNCTWNDKETITVKVEGSDIQYTISDTVVCPRDTVTLQFNSAGVLSVTPQSFIIDTPNTVLLIPDTTIQYTVVTQSPQCNYIDTTVYAITVRVPSAAFDVSPQELSLDEPTVQVFNTSDWYTGLNWLLNVEEIALNHGSYTLTDTGEQCFTLIASQADKCFDTAVHCIYVDGMAAIAIPNAFTPNGDGKNDYFTILGNDIVEYELRIYNRWGEQVYYSTSTDEVNSTNKGWDGTYKNTPQGTGTFIYYISCKTKSGQVFKKSESIVLIR